MADTQQVQDAPRRARKAERNRAMLLDHLADVPFELIGARHGVTAQRVGEIVRRERRAYLLEVETQLMTAQKMGVGGPQFVVDFAHDGWQRSMCAFVWTLSRLRDRQVPVRVTTQQTTEGTIFLLEHQKEQ